MTAEVMADSPMRGIETKSQRQAGDCVPGSPKIDQACIVKQLEFLPDLLLERPKATVVLKSPFVFKGMHSTHMAN